MSKKKAKKIGRKQASPAAVSAGMRRYWAKKKAGGGVAVTAAVESPKVGVGLSAEQITDIIGACAAKGVLSFQYGDLQLLFKKPLDEPTTGDSRTRSFRDTLDPVEGASRLAPGQALQEVSDTVAEELDHLKITDPAAYEAFIQSEDADDGDDGC